MTSTTQFPFQAVPNLSAPKIGPSIHNLQINFDLAGGAGRKAAAAAEGEEERSKAGAESWMWEAAEGPGEEDPFKEDWAQPSTEPED